jgi:hypothetical protein
VITTVLSVADVLGATNTGTELQHFLRTKFCFTTTLRVSWLVVAYNKPCGVGLHGECGSSSVIATGVSGVIKHPLQQASLSGHPCLVVMDTWLLKYREPESARDVVADC